MAQRTPFFSTAPGDRRRPSRAAPLALFALFASVIALGGAIAYTAGMADLRRQEERELANVASFKVREVERWLQERLADARAIAADPVLREGVGPPGSAPTARLAAEVERWFELFRGHGEFGALALLEIDDGGVYAVRGVERNATDPQVRALARRAAAARRPLVGGLRGPEGRDVPHLLLVAPILPRQGATRLALLVRMDPAPDFFPMLQTWPAASYSAETLLVRPDRDAVLVVNTLRHTAAAPGTLRIPLSRRDDPTTLAAVGGRHLAEGLDYRGSRVLAAVEPVEGTPWTLVAKMDAAEALSAGRGLAASVVLVSLAFVVASGSGVLLWWRRQLAALERAWAAGEAERNALGRRLDQLTRHATDMVFLADENLRLVEVNERAARALGYERAELLGMPTRELRDPETLADFEEHVREQIEKGASMFETRYRRKDGTTFPVEVTVHSEVFEGRRWFQGIARDVSARTATEKALRDSEARFRALFEQASVGMALLDATGRMVGTNRAFRELLGYSEAQAAKLRVSDLREESGGPAPYQVFARLRDGEAESLEIPRRYRRPDGELVEAILRATAVRDEEGALRFVLEVFEDVTERKRIEAQLVLADRMASVGTLAAGIAHEINNPLSFVLSNLDFSIAELRTANVDPEVRRALEDARSGGVRVRAIVRDLKSFSRGGDEAREPLDVRNVLRSALGLAANELRQRAEVTFDPGDVPLVLASERRLAQVFLNLLINAAQAVPEGNVSGNRIRAATATAPDGRALVEISDTGCGIPPELRSRIFDPFFTTKPVGVGTGLGLSICHAIVTQHGGEISVESVPGEGSTFRVLLPATARGTVGRQPPPAPSPPSAARRGRVLVVDDEVPIGRAIQRILSPHHEVVARTSARDALADLLASGEHYDVVLCDLMMPDMTGMELHARLREASPALADRMVFLTGGAFTRAASSFLESVPNPRVDKPFDPGALRELVARLVGDGGTPAPADPDGRARP